MPLIHEPTGYKYRPRLKIAETFISLQGEGVHSGYPCAFIRLTGCALRCTYCDSEYAFYGGTWKSFEELFFFLGEQPVSLVQITGGEPLHQKAVLAFMDHLVERGYQPLLETGGAVDIRGTNRKTHIVLDIKTPESGEADRMLWSNLDLLKPSDEVKFVVCSEKDLSWSLNKIEKLNLTKRFQVLISPVASAPNKATFAERLMESGVQARFQVQLHKVLWGDTPGK